MQNNQFFTSVARTLCSLALAMVFPAPSVHAQAIPVFKTDTFAAAIEASTEVYLARVTPDGMLPSLKLHGTEFLKTVGEGIPRGAYLYQDGVLDLSSIKQSGQTITASGAGASIQYHFSEDSVSATVTNSSTSGMSYYIVFDPAVTSIETDEGQTVKAPKYVGVQMTPSLFAGQSRLKIDAGPAGLELATWGDEQTQFQIANIALQAGQTRTVTFLESRASGR